MIKFEGTFSPIVIIKSICKLISIKAPYNFKICQTNVKITFLNDNLDEHIYMVQPYGFIEKEQEQQVSELKRSIYKLK